MAEIRAQPGPQSAFLSTHADVAVYGGAAGGGKMLCLNTAIPTPRGFIALHDIHAGDTIFGRGGQAITVLAESPVVTVPGWRLRFDDGSDIVAHDDHLWLTFNANERAALTRSDEDWRERRRASRPSRAQGHKSALFSETIRTANAARTGARVDRQQWSRDGSVRTTAEIVATLQTQAGRRNHAVPVADVLSLPAKCLPLDPYLLGLWLGDGHTNSSHITTMDSEIVAAFLDAGFRVGHEVRKPNNRAATYRFEGLRQILQAIGVLGKKHVPHDYLWGSEEQRLALLQGLLDTDGNVSKASVEFVNTNRALTEAVAHLARSLGNKVTIREGRARIYGEDHGPVWKVKFSANRILFRLPRKMGRQTISSRRTTRFRYIESAERVEAVSMKCLQVSSEDHLYLVGESFIPTHNSYGLLLEPLHYVKVRGFQAAFFRRERGQITAPGSLWDVSKTIYPHVGARPRETQLDWRFASGSTLKFAGMEHEKDKLAWQGSAMAMLGFDELTHFSAEMFFYMLSRNRTTCGVRPYVRATTNPDADSWVADLVSWYINQETGFPIPERSGVLRYFTRVNDQMIWGDTPAEAKQLASEASHDADPTGIWVKSFTFIPAKLTDNPALTSQGPEYLASLQALPLVERERLLGGNWKIRAGAGKIFNRAWWKAFNPRDFYDPADPSQSRFEQVIQVWDTAFSEKAGSSYSVCATWGLYENNYYLLDIFRSHVPFPILRREAIRLATLWQPHAVLIEAKASGQSLIQEMRRAVKLPVIAVAILPGDDKVKRASAVSLHVEGGRVFLPEGAPFVSSFIEEHAGFPDGSYTDQVDTTSMALARLAGGRIGVAQYQTDDYEPTGADQAIGEDALPVTAQHKMRKADPEEIAETDLNQYLHPAQPVVLPMEPLDFSGAILE